MGIVSGKGTDGEKGTIFRKFQRMAIDRMKTSQEVGELAGELVFDDK
jgi:hypothetical protein